VEILSSLSQAWHPREELQLLRDCREREVGSQYFADYFLEGEPREQHLSSRFDRRKCVDDSSEQEQSAVQRVGNRCEGRVREFVQLHNPKRPRTGSDVHGLNTTIDQALRSPMHTISDWPGSFCVA
jgi:hypothetical protein